ncbi:MAG: efflux RND transporter periplasmic adaptor subunit [Terracidiphilus sp.]|jgi:ABC exporter DevB family membrane fusion protein
MANKINLSRAQIILLLSLGMLAACGIALTSSAAKHKQTPRAEQGAVTKTMIAGPGLIEPDSEDVKVGSELAGKLQDVLVEEGARVKKGQVLAILVNDDYLAAVEASKAQVHEKDAAYHKVLNGSRAQERKAAFASFQEAKSVDANAKIEWQRRQQLWQAGVISKEEMENFERDYHVDEAKLEAAHQQFKLIDDQSREEDIAAAKAQLEYAQAQLSQNQAVYAKTFLRAPFDGTILRKHHRTGESITNSSVTPDPVFTMGDVNGLRVRVDVDETDVSRVAEGQKVYVTAQAYGARKFFGHVIRVGGQLGHKNVRTDEPQEKVDTKILECLVQLNPGVTLPVGLRVDAYIQTQ